MTKRKKPKEKAERKLHILSYSIIRSALGFFK